MLLELQQHLPFTVLKPASEVIISPANSPVATALTVYGIETLSRLTCSLDIHSLQQHLPFTVLKLFSTNRIIFAISLLQQHLPFTVYDKKLNNLIGNTLQTQKTLP